MPRILVIIVTYNGEQWIETCLQCLNKSIQRISVMIVDNASSDQTKKIIKTGFTQFTLVEGKQNSGFGQANNIAMKYALDQGFDYVFLLNQDAYIYPDTIKQLLYIHQNHPEYGIISPLQLNSNGSKPDEVFERFISNNYPKNFIADLDIRKEDLPEVFPVRFVNAAAWFISRECLRKVGYFHPLFYHYGEDNNYCSRAQYHGFKTGITPTASVRHDKVYARDPLKLLSRQVHLVPLYILLDLRKSRPLTWLLVFWKMIGYFSKGIRLHSSEVRKNVLKEIKWILKSRRVIAKARREMSQ